MRGRNEEALVTSPGALTKVIRSTCEGNHSVDCMWSIGSTDSVDFEALGQPEEQIDISSHSCTTTDCAKI